MNTDEIKFQLVQESELLVLIQQFLKENNLVLMKQEKKKQVKETVKEHQLLLNLFEKTKVHISKVTGISYNYLATGINIKYKQYETLEYGNRKKSFPGVLLVKAKGYVIALALEKIVSESSGEIMYYQVLLRADVKHHYHYNKVYKGKKNIKYLKGVK